MTSIEEGRIHFDFDEDWLVVRWDTSKVYRCLAPLSGEVDDRVEGTKAMDFVGVRDGSLYFFEIKDFRGHRIENAQRQRKELPLEVGLKVRDTLAGVTGAFVKSGKMSGAPWIERCGEALFSRKAPVHVVVWIAEDLPGPREQQKKRDVRDSERMNQMKRKLAWLTSKVLVEDPLQTKVPGVSTRNLAGAGAR